MRRMCACGNIFLEKTLVSRLKGLFSVAGKTALITGGGSGIGGFMAQSLSEEGGTVLLVGRREDKLKKVLGARDGKNFVIDLCKAGASERLFTMVSDCGYQPDIIVNAAGINPRLHADKIDEEMWTYTVHLNLNVPFLVAQKFVPGMKANGWGRIINIASMYGVISPDYRIYKYCIDAVQPCISKWHILWFCQGWCDPTHACHG